MTLQEIFDKTCGHLRTMPGRSWDGRQCVYRAPCGNRCVVGWFIPDADYYPDLEDK